MERGFALRAIKHEGVELPKQEFDRIVKTADGMLKSQHLRASPGIKAAAEQYRCGFMP